MRAIDSYTEEQYEEQVNVLKNLREKTKSIREHELIDYTRKTGYAHYEFEGTITQKLVDLLGRTPTADEIIMLVDDGFSHFGATCHLEGMRFSGRVNTD